MSFPLIAIISICVTVYYVELDLINSSCKLMMDLCNVHCFLFDLI